MLGSNVNEQSPGPALHPIILIFSHSFIIIPLRGSEGRGDEEEEPWAPSVQVEVHNRTPYRCLLPLRPQLHPAAGARACWWLVHRGCALQMWVSAGFIHTRPLAQELFLPPHLMNGRCREAVSFLLPQLNGASPPWTPHNTFSFSAFILFFTCCIYLCPYFLAYILRHWNSPRTTKVLTSPVYGPRAITPLVPSSWGLNEGWLNLTYSRHPLWIFFICIFILSKQFRERSVDTITLAVMYKGDRESLECFPVWRACWQEAWSAKGRNPWDWSRGSFCGIMPIGFAGSE